MGGMELFPERPYILLTSFRRSSDLREPMRSLEKWSCAVYQPRGFDYPKVDAFDIRDDLGRWTRPRDFVGSPDPLAAYRQALMGIYLSRSRQIMDWLDAVQGRRIALCCWCPYDKAAQRQLSEWGTYVCHTGVIYEFLRDLVDVRLDADRDRLVRLWDLTT